MKKLLLSFAAVGLLSSSLFACPGMGGQCGAKGGCQERGQYSCGMPTCGQKAKSGEYKGCGANSYSSTESSVPVAVPASTSDTASTQEVK